MSIKNKTQLKAEVTTAIRVGGQPAKTKATDVRNLLHNVIDSSVSTINDILPDANGNVTLNLSGAGSTITVNGIAPDANGNIVLNLNDTSKVSSVNGILPDGNGNVSLELVSNAETRQHFSLRPNDEPSGMFFFETGPVTFRETYFSSQIEYNNYRVRVLDGDGTGEWSNSMKIDELNEFALNLSDNSQYEVEIEPVFTELAIAAGEDVRGLLIYSPGVA